MTIEEKAKHYATDVGVFGTVYFNDVKMQAYLAGAKELEQENNHLKEQIDKLKNALLDIKANTDDVNIEWQIKYLFDELDSKE